MAPILPVFAALAAAAAQEAGPRFEVASVKPRIDLPGKAMFLFGGNSFDTPIEVSGTRVYTLGSLTNLVLAAYQLRDYQLAGDLAIPGRGRRDQLWIIDARTPGDQPPSLDQVRAMLRNLLVERFQLKFHHETKELTAYDLVLAPKGPKLSASAPGAPPRHEEQYTAGQTIRYKWENLFLWQLTARIAKEFDKPLVDKTGLAGGYDITLEYTPRRPGNLTPEMAQAAEKALGPEDDGKSVVSGLRSIGLNVVPAKERIDVMVIDHAEPPAEN